MRGNKYRPFIRGKPKSPPDGVGPGGAGIGLSYVLERMTTPLARGPTGFYQYHERRA